jgi:hypothetical protein
MVTKTLAVYEEVLRSRDASVEPGDEPITSDTQRSPRAGDQLAVNG